MGKPRKAMILFNDWTGGDWGSQDGLLVAKNNLPMFHGENVQYYRSGALGPRPGSKQASHTGPVPDETDRQFHFGFDLAPGFGGVVAGRLTDFVNSQPGGTIDLFVCVVDTSPGQAFVVVGVTPGGVPPYSYATGPYNNLTVGESGFHYIGAQRLDDAPLGMGAPVTVGAAANRPARTIMYRDRMYYYAMGPTVFYSQPGAYNTVPATNFFNLNNRLVENAFIFKNTLYFVTTEDVKLPWSLFALTGASPAVGSIAEVHKQTPIMRGESFCVAEDGVYGIHRGYQCVWKFNGQEFETMRHLTIDPNHNPLGAQYVYDFSMSQVSYASALDAIAIPYKTWQAGNGSYRTSGAIERVNGVWCYSTYPGNNWSSFTGANLKGLAADPNRWIFKWINNSGTGTPNPATYWVRQVTLDRPGSTLDSNATRFDNFPQGPFDNGAKPFFFLPPVTDPDGNDAVMIDKIEVELDYWKNSSEYPDPPTLTCTLHPVGYFQDATGALGATQVTTAMNEAIANWGTTPAWDPLRRRVVFTPAPHTPAEAIYIKFSNIEAVAIHRVRVSAEFDGGSYPGGW